MMIAAASLRREMLKLLEVGAAGVRSDKSYSTPEKSLLSLSSTVFGSWAIALVGSLGFQFPDAHDGFTSLSRRAIRKPRTGRRCGRPRLPRATISQKTSRDAKTQLLLSEWIGQWPRQTRFPLQSLRRCTGHRRKGTPAQLLGLRGRLRCRRESRDDPNEVSCFTSVYRSGLLLSSV